MRPFALLALALVLALAPAALRAEDEPAGAAAEAGESAEAAPAQEASGADDASAEGDGATLEEEKITEDPTEFLTKLVARVRREAAAEQEQDRAREAEFQRALDEQTRLLEDTQAKVAREEAASLALDDLYARNELELEELGLRLTERMGQMGELFGVVRLVATDMGAVTWDSMTSAGLEPRGELLERLGRSKDLPSTRDMQALWFELQREMTEQARISRFVVPVRLDEETTEPREVLRAGPFVAISGGEYLTWRSAEQMLRRLERPPPPRYARTARDFLDANGAGFARLAVDPSRGALLEALTRTPSRFERIQQGGFVGYTAIALGVAALLIGLVRWVDLWLTGRRVEEQTRSSRASDDNPLGRLRAVYEAHRHADPEALELKLDDAILRESGHVERWLWLVQTVSIVAPLLGLLGTVTGMIQTFQAITLFGAGDPTTMAKGISEALVTTMLGLVIAIPLVLLYALLSTRTRAIIEALEEGSAAMVAESLTQRSGAR